MESGHGYTVVQEIGDLREEIMRGYNKYGPMLSLDDGWSRMQREIEELREAVHAWNPRGADQASEDRVLEEALQVAAMAMRLRRVLDE